MIKKVFRYLFITLFGAVGCLFLLLHSPIVQEKAVAMIKEAVFEATGLSVEIGKISIGLPRSITLRDLSLKGCSDLHIKSMTFKIDLLALIDKRMAFSYSALISDEIEIYGKLYLSQSKSLDGSTIHLSSVELSELFRQLKLKESPSGTFKFDGLVSGDLLAPHFELKGVADGLTYKGIAKSLQMEMTGIVAEGLIEGHLAVFPDDQSKTITLHADYSYPLQGLLTLNNIHLNETGVALNGSLQINPQDPWPVGVLEGAIEDLSIFKIPNILGMSGKANFTAHFSHSPSAPFIFHAESPKLSYDGVSFRGVLLQSTHTLSSHEFHLNLGKVSKGKNALRDLTIAATLNSSEAEIPSLTIRGLFGSGTLDGEIAYREGLMSGNIRLDHVDVESLLASNKVLLPLQGTLHGNLSLAGPLDDPEMELELQASNLIYADIPLGCTLSATLSKGMLSGLGTFASSTAESRFNWLFPVNFSFQPFNIGLANDALISGNMKAAGAIAPLFQLIGLKVPFSGDADLALELYGTIAKPQIFGSCNLTNGSYEIPKIGVALQNISGQLEIQNSHLAIRRLEAEDGQGGMVIAKGTALLDPLSHYPFELKMELKNALLLQQDNILAICEGPLTFKGDGVNGLLEGHLKLIKGRIKIPERPIAVVNSVDVIYLNIPKTGEKPPQTAFKTADWPLNLKVDLDIPENLSIKGKGLKSSWKGSLKIEGQSNAPLILGELHIVDGRYLFNGSPFEIEKGSITFAGDADKKTTLYVIATKDLDKVKVDVIAKGSINNPEISFRSNPPLPQREILSWLLFNRGTSEISPFQGTQLSESITNLKSNQGGPDILTKIRSAFGIDRFEITRNANSESDTEVNVQVGKYISKDVLVSMIKSDVNSLAVEAALSNRVKLQAQVGDDAQGKLILKWKRNY